MALMSAEIYLTSQNWQNSAVLNPTIFLNLASPLTLMRCLVIRKVPQLMCLVVIFIVVIKGNLEGPGARNYLRHISVCSIYDPLSTWQPHVALISRDWVVDQELLLKYPGRCEWSCLRHRTKHVSVHFRLPKLCLDNKGYLSNVQWFDHWLKWKGQIRFCL